MSSKTLALLARRYRWPGLVLVIGGVCSLLIASEVLGYIGIALTVLVAEVVRNLTWPGSTGSEDVDGIDDHVSDRDDQLR